MRQFCYVEGGPTADLTIEAYGSTLAEIFENAALAVFNAMTPLDGVEKRETRVFRVSDGDLGGLLYDFLDELLFVHETDLIVFSEVRVSLDRDQLQLSARCQGERFNPERHESGMVIKAVTFHQMKIEQRERCWFLRVVMDT